MEQPFHSMQTAQTRGITPQKAAGLIAAIALQAVFVYALASGLAQTLMEKIPEELKVAVEQEKTPPKVPPPPPPQLETPPPPFVPPPEIVIQTEAAPTNAITTQNVVKAPPPPVVVPHQTVSSPASIGRPHVCTQNYPDISVRLNEEGTTTLSFHIAVDGSVNNVAVAKSSGFPRLDEAALSCAGRWRYKPAMQDGNPVEVPWQANVQWKLH